MKTIQSEPELLSQFLAVKLEFPDSIFQKILQALMWSKEAEVLARTELLMQVCTNRTVLLTDDEHFSNSRGSTAC